MTVRVNYLSANGLLLPAVFSILITFIFILQPMSAFFTCFEETHECSETSSSVSLIHHCDHCACTIHSEPSRQYSSGVILRGRLVTMNANRDVIEDGKMFIKNGRIQAIIQANSSWPSGVDTTGAIYIETGGTIYPGLINNHDHMGYNVLPIWNVPSIYPNRYAWGGGGGGVDYPPYKENVTRLINFISSDGNLLYKWEEVGKWAEIKHLSAGTTAVQGCGQTYTANTYDAMLVRNVDLTNWGTDYVQTKVSKLDSSYNSTSLINNMNSGTCKAFFIHLCEGVDSASENEFQILKSKGLNRNETIIIHGTAMTPQDWAEAAVAGTKLCWSPTSNLLLYGQTTDVVNASKAGVLISLGTDWSPSGGKNLLDELKIAWTYNLYRLGGFFTPQQLVEMVTINPARQNQWQDKVGSLVPGLYADIAVFNGTHHDPYMHLIEATQRDVRLVMIEGDPLFGDVDIMRLLKGNDMEIITSITGFQKAVDCTKQGITRGDETYSYLNDTLSHCLPVNWTWAHQNVRSSSLRNMTYEQFRASVSTNPGKFNDKEVLDPVFSEGDAYYFNALKNSRNANFPINIEQLYYSWSNTSFELRDYLELRDMTGRTRGIAGQPFEFQLLYTHPAGTVPTSVKLYINGTGNTITYSTGHPTTGAIYNISRTLPAGTYTYWFEVRTTRGLNITVPQRISIISSSPDIRLEDLSDSSWGSAGLNRNFTVRYFHTLGLLPDKAELYIDEKSYNLLAGTGDPSSGKIYYLNTPLSPGWHTFWFEFRAGNSYNFTAPCIVYISSNIGIVDRTEPIGFSSEEFNFSFEITNALGTTPSFITLYLGSSIYNYTTYSLNLSGGSPENIMYCNWSITLLNGTYLYWLKVDAGVDTNTSFRRMITMVKRDHAPVLEDHTILPENLTNTTLITFSAVYLDIDNDPVLFPNLVLDGVPRLMTRITAGSDFTTPVTYQLSMQVSRRIHTYYFAFKNQTTEITTSPKTFSVGPNTAPSIEDKSPISGIIPLNTNITFRAAYTDAEGDPALEACLVLNDVRYNMTRIPEGSSWWGRILFEFNTTPLLEGQYSYYFIFSDFSKNSTSSLRTFLVRNDTEPVLTDITNISGAVKPGINQTFRVLYRDLDGDAPASAYLVLNGKSILLSSNTTSPPDYRNGTVFYASTLLTQGLHEYYFEFSVLGKTARTQSKKILANYPPELQNIRIEPSGGRADQPHTISVYVLDREGEPPVGVYLSYGSSIKEMTKASPQDEDYKSGVKYEYTGTLPAGRYNINISVSDGKSTNEVIYSYEVNILPAKSGWSKWGGAIIVIIVLIVVLGMFAAVGYYMYQKKRRNIDKTTTETADSAAQTSGKTIEKEDTLATPPTPLDNKESIEAAGKELTNDAAPTEEVGHRPEDNRIAEEKSKEKSIKKELKQGKVAKKKNIRINQN